MAFAWSDDLTVGVTEIDAQHKELIVRVNKLLEATTQGRGRAELGETVGFLGSYVVTHFRDEEAYMRKIAYPGLVPQQAEHKQFLGEFAGLRARLAADGATSELAIIIQRQVCSWLVRHINGSDKQIGKFARG
jgi:hemerythrin